MSKRSFAVILLTVSVLAVSDCRSGTRIDAVNDPAENGESYITQKISAFIDPYSSFIRVDDLVTIPACRVKDGIAFLLLGGLEVESLDPGVRIELDRSDIIGVDPGIDREDLSVSPSIVKKRYIVQSGSDQSGDLIFNLRYRGQIDYPVEEAGEEYARSFGQSPGIISADGVYLGGSTFWVPSFDDGLIRFSLTVDLPEGWDAVSQGQRTVPEQPEGRTVVVWDSPEPMEEVFLIAARFTEYTGNSGHVEVNAFLRSPDEALASKYIETTSIYLDLFSGMLGPYPYSKFALVENFWETGYGMPSFTLLGEKVIRFPFILHSSYPHELLHNWWGNSVYVDFDSGNWCEGITTYMADHLIKEQRGQGVEYRRSTLKKFTDHVTGENDFPLSSFTSRTSASSEAVGYGKSLMTWNMLREKTGDRLFIEAFRKFYSENRFRKASFDDIRKSFEEVTGEDLKGFFTQWVEREGAPELELTGCEVREKNGGNQLRFTISQVQKEAPFDLDIPVAVAFSDSVSVIKVGMKGRRVDSEISFGDKPLSVQVDPSFDLMRRLHPNESPPSLSAIFGARSVLILLPSEEDGEPSGKYRRLAERWVEDSSREIRILNDTEIGKIPAEGSVWIFGEKNRYRGIVEDGMKAYKGKIEKSSVSFGTKEMEKSNNSFIIAVRHPENPASVAVWLTIGDDEAVDGLSRKLPHYGKYSYLAFEGSAPDNILKGNWQAADSPLFVKLSSDDDSGPAAAKIPERKPLAEIPQSFSAERMLGDVIYLASEELKGRGPGTEGIESAARFIADNFRKAGLKPGSDDGTFFQEWEGITGPGEKKGHLRNVIGVVPGSDKGKEGKSVLICAHYDHLGLGWPDHRAGNEGKVHYGADDNASGVAVMLELARYFGRETRPERTLVFAAFTCEEDHLRGSGYYVKNYKQFPPGKTIGVINLDTVGRLFGKKVLVIGSSSAGEWKYIFQGSGYVTGVDVEIVSQDLDSSDQCSFIEAGIPAVQLFSGVHSDYHTPEDTPEKIDPDGMVSIASLAREAVLFLAERKEPMVFTGKDGTAGIQGKSPAAARKAGTGSMPDFTYSGEGVRLGEVKDGSPAGSAGLKKGDIIVMAGGSEVKGLREYSEILKRYQPGDEVEFVILRGQERISVTVILGER
ncbi:MAG: M20/M25/M40 family metallo-hydrolase [Candidatus Krumholzibacteriota bacterium]|nr:M20/M25/M40 family metallo-hydrolase [Candidatus Krumholzibacteriota bacterium]